MTTADERERLAAAQQAAEARWAYRPLKTYVYKETPQGEPEIHVHYPFDWRQGDRRPGFLNDPPWFKRTLYRTDRFLASLGLLEGRPTFPAPGAPRLVRGL